MLSLFITEPEIVAQGANDFRVFFISYIVLGFWVVILTLMQSLGRASKASVLVLLTHEFSLSDLPTCSQLLADPFS